MTTFAVYGTSVDAFLHKAQKACERDPEARQLPVAAWGRRVREVAAELAEKSEPVCLSAWFDSPQFAQGFLELAQRSGCRQLSIRCRKRVQNDAGEWKTVVSDYEWAW